MSSFNLEPIDFLGLLGSDSWNFSGGGLGHVASGGDTLTPQQAIAYALALQQKSKKKGSFATKLKNAGKVGLNPVLWTFDKLLRPNYGIASAAQQGLKGRGFDVGDALHGFREGFMGRNKIGFGEVLRQENPRGIPWLQGLAGFGLDVATDPLTYLTLGTTGVGKGVAGGALKEIAKEVPAGLTAREAVTHAADLQKAINVLDSLGPKFSERAALGRQKQIALQVDPNLGTPLKMPDSWMENLSVARARAAAEAKLNDPRQLRVDWRVPLTGKKIGANTGIRVPKTRLGDLGIPLLSPAAKGLGKAFKPGYEDPIEYASALSKRHIGERLTSEYFSELRDRFGKVQALPEDRAKEVISFFEKHGDDLAPAVIRGGDDYVLNPERIAAAKAAGFTDDELAFVQAMHDTTRSLAKKHAERGIRNFEAKDFAPKGRFYFPHIVERGGKPMNDVERNLLSERGFLKKRHLDLTVKQIDNLSKRGELGVKIETNPYTALAKHARSVANQHADQALINHLVGTHGLQTRLVDTDALGKLAKTREDTIERLTRARDASARRGPGLERALSDQKKKLYKDTKKAYEDRIRDNTAAIRRHLEGPHTQTTMATVARLSKYNATLKDRMKADLEAIQSGTHKAVAKKAKTLAEARKAVDGEVVKLERLLKALDRQERKLLKGTKNPAYSGKKHSTLKLTDEFGHKIAVPPQIHNEMTRLEKIVAANDETLDAFTHGYRKYLGKWKVAVTTLNVGGYGIRNTLSDFWNMYLAGVPMAQAIRFGGKAAHLMKAAKAGDPKALREINQAYDAGVLSGLFGGDVQQVANMLEHAGSKRALAKNKRFLALTNKVTQDINRNRENWGRLTHYLYRRHNGASVEEASEWVRKAHFDYEELTPFEQERMKVVAPFYTWSRKNVPFQLQALAFAPGRMAAFPKFAMEMDQAAGGSEGDILPEYMRDGMFLKLPGGKYAPPMIGITDLMKPFQPVDAAKSLVTPTAKVPFELLTNKNLLTGNEIAGKHERNPVNEMVAPLLSLIPGANVGPTARKDLVTGKVARGTGAAPWLTHILGSTPLTNMLVNQTGSIKTEQRQGDSTKPLISWLTGVNLNQVNQPQQEAIASLEFQDQVDKMIQKLRDEGLFPQSKKTKKSKNEKLIELALLNSLRG